MSTAMLISDSRLFYKTSRKGIPKGNLESSRQSTEDPGHMGMPCHCKKTNIEQGGDEMPGDHRKEGTRMDISVDLSCESVRPGVRCL